MTIKSIKTSLGIFNYCCVASVVVNESLSIVTFFDFYFTMLVIKIFLPTILQYSKWTHKVLASSDKQIFWVFSDFSLCCYPCSYLVQTSFLAQTFVRSQNLLYRCWKWAIFWQKYVFLIFSRNWI